MPAAQNRMMFSPLSLQRVDREQGRIIGAAVATGGEAKGHGVWVDETTLEQVAALGNAAASGVKMRWGHPLPFDTSPGSYVGKAYNFRVEGQKCLCDIQLSTVKNLKGDTYNYTLDLAESAPDSFGLSMAFGYAPRKGKKGKFNGFQLVDITSLDAIDFVDTPAANAGLFNSNTESEQKEATMPTEKKSFRQWEAKFGREFACAHFDDLEFDEATQKWAEVSLADLQKENEALKVKCAELEAKLAAPPPPPIPPEKKKEEPPMAAPPPPPPTPAPEVDVEDDTEMLKAKIAELEAKLKEAGVKMSAYSKGQSNAPVSKTDGKQESYMDKVMEFSKTMSKGQAFAKATQEFPSLYETWVLNNRK